jgi:hypothetical protein
MPLKGQCFKNADKKFEIFKRYLSLFYKAFESINGQAEEKGSFTKKTSSMQN